MGTSMGGDKAVLDWRKATMIAAVSGGLFWGLTAGLVTVSNAARPVIVAVGIAAAILMIVGATLTRRSLDAATRVWGMGMTLAPLTGATPILILWLSGLIGSLFA